MFYQVGNTALFKAMLYAASIFVLWSCSKNTDDEPIEIDYRNQYCGIWNFTTERINYISPDSTDVGYSMSQHKGPIWYNQAGKINIHHKENHAITFEINELGELHKDAPYPISGYFVSTDSLFFAIFTNDSIETTTEWTYGVRN